MRYVNFGAFAPPEQHCTPELGSRIRFFGAPIPDCNFGAFPPAKQHCTSELGSGIRFFDAPNRAMSGGLDSSIRLAPDQSPRAHPVTMGANNMKFVERLTARSDLAYIARIWARAFSKQQNGIGVIMRHACRDGNIKMLDRLPQMSIHNSYPFLFCKKVQDEGTVSTSNLELVEETRTTRDTDGRGVTGELESGVARGASPLQR